MKKAIKALNKTLPEIIRFDTSLLFFCFGLNTLITFFFLSVFVLLAINLYFFSLMGLLAFPRYYRIDDTPANITNGSLKVFFTKHNVTHHFEKNKVFGSLMDSINSLIILLTTSNNPDVMEQAYSRNRFTSLFYIIYLLIGYYCIMSLVTAVIYNKFKGFFRDSMITSAFRQSLGIFLNLKCLSN